ncbi:MAG: hypothetical protein M5U28_36620 [Sandaracinaceae bacterium]|nr:hypothetical protein [Sandaracinaceae bacterium]
MSELAPCTGCGRHVRLDDPACPFCGGTARQRARPPRVARSVTRAAIFYLGATLAGCDGSTEPEPEESIVQPYGAPPDPQPPEPEPPEPEPEQEPAPGEPTEPAQAEPGLDDSVLEGTVGQPYGGGAIPPRPGADRE